MADLQDPPEMIVAFLREWEAGHKVVIGVKAQTHETFLLKAVRRFYYNLVTKIANINLFFERVLWLISAVSIMVC